ncbi:MAG: DUF4286 family protein [Bacteroidetes bacterium]|jgi:quinol monooxygenase YgiN|nr:DUF4286 family protein [Bacteroidota bacterium]
MTIYEVNLHVDAAAASAYADWLPTHIDEMLAIDGFEKATWYTVEDAEDDRVHWCIHYQLGDRAALEAYFDGPAEAMRQEGLERFEGQFTADRRILSLAPPAAAMS